MKGAVNMEVWKDVVGFEGLYQVSNCGNVKSLSKKVPYRTYGTWKERTLPECIMKANENEFGYLYVGFVKDKVRSKHKVHRLVAEAFLPNPNGKRCVNHKDGNKKNNCVENLEWSTHSENMKHAADNGLWTAWNKGTHYSAKPRSEETKRKISETKKAYYRQLKTSKQKAQ